MKIRFALLFLLSSFAVGQIAAPILGAATAVACTAPTGTHFTETADSSTLCWAAGPSNCNQTWTIVGTLGQSVVSSPVGAPANTACANAIQVNYVNGVAASAGANFTAITTGTFDVIGTVYITTGVSAGNSGWFWCLTVASGTCDTTGAIASLKIVENTGQKFESDGSTNSAQIALTTATWHTFDVHVDLTTRTNCSMSIDGGAAQTFTCNTGSPATIYLGPQHFTGSSYNYDIGNIAF